jgi:hypothetical protein
MPVERVLDGVTIDIANPLMDSISVRCCSLIRLGDFSSGKIARAGQTPIRGCIGLRWAIGNQKKSDLKASYLPRFAFIDCI